MMPSPFFAISATIAVGCTNVRNFVPLNVQTINAYRNTVF